MTARGTSSETPLVSIVMGSDSDLKQMAESAKILEEFEIPFEIKGSNRT